MAGRGRRIGGYGEARAPLRRPGEAVVPTLQSADINIQSLIRKIGQIISANVDPILLHEIEILFKQLCVTGESVKDVLLNLHCKALSDASFGEKLVLALEPVMSIEIDNTCVRSELLTFIESDFKMKDTMCQSDSQKFINAVMLLGSVYNSVKIQGVPIMVLGLALLEYIQLLLQGDEEQLRVLTTQIFLNGSKFLMTENLAPKYQLLKHSLRSTLIQRNLTVKAKCWILLALDLMSNDLKPLQGVVRDFYLDNMGDDYTYLESFISSTCDKGLSDSGHNSTTPSGPPKSFSTSPGSPPRKTPPKSDKPNKKKDGFIQKVENLNVDEDRKPGARHPLNRSFRDNVKSNDNPLQSRNKRFEAKKGKASKEESEFNADSARCNIFPEGPDDFYGIQIEKEKVVDSDKKGIEQK